MQQYVESGDLSGAVTVVGRRDGIVAFDAVGYRDLATKEPMRKDTLFYVASMTKPLTAVGVMILVDEGKLSPDDELAKHLPEFAGLKLKDGKPPARPVTVRDVLTHTSGLGNPPDLADVYRKRDRTLAAMAAVTAKLPLQFEPGSKWQYSNSGIDTLGRLIEVLSKDSYEHFMKKRIFDPLGMTDTVFYPTEEQAKRLAGLYNKKAGQLVPETYTLNTRPANPKHPIPAGGLVSTAADMATVCRKMLHKGELNGKRIITEKSWTAMTRTHTGDLDPAGFVPGMSYGYGWAVVKKPEGVTAKLSPGSFGHGGAFGTQYWIDPKQDLFVVLMIQRLGLPNADASGMRQALQELAVEAIKK
jgi:CubicO group peptidase (beta-lactamase class C family)